MKQFIAFIITVLWFGISFAENNVVKSKQILLRNNIVFKDGQSSNGASAFIIRYDGSLYAVTAKHMLNDWMGFDPAIPPSEVNQKLQSWSLYTPDTDEMVAEIAGIVNPSDDWDRDIIILALKRHKNNAFRAIEVSQKQPKKGDIFYIIGCPYAEIACKQNHYPLVYQETSVDGVHEFLWENKTISSRGFSGAPIVDENGRAFGTYHGYNTKTNVYFANGVLQELQQGRETKRREMN